MDLDKTKEMSGKCNGNSKYKGLEVGVCLVCSRKSEEARVLE